MISKKLDLNTVFSVLCTLYVLVLSFQDHLGPSSECLFSRFYCSQMLTRLIIREFWHRNVLRYMHCGIDAIHQDNMYQKCIPP